MQTGTSLPLRVGVEPQSLPLRTGNNRGSNRGSLPLTRRVEEVCNPRIFHLGMRMAPLVTGTTKNADWSLCHATAVMVTALLTPPYHIIMTTYYRSRYGYSYWDLRQLCLLWLMAPYSYDATVTPHPRPHQSYSRSRHSCCHSYDATMTVTHCPRPSQLFRIQAFLLPLLVFLLLPAKPTAIVADIAILLAEIHSYGNLRAFIWLWLPHY